MFNPLLLNTEVQQFIENYEGSVSKLAFAGSSFENISVQELMQQVEGKRKTAKKLPLWSSTPNIYFPPKINLEQTSSEITARYKASLLQGKSIADITGGFGVDSFYFSEKVKTVHHFEINNELSEIARHNFKVFGKSNIECFSEDGLEIVLKKKYDIIYADPSRRHESKGKVFFLKDCLPDIPSHISQLLEHCEIFILKTSPMLDLSVGLSELSYVFEIHIIAIENEVKELLWLSKKDFVDSPIIKTVNFTKTGEDTFNFEWGQEADVEYSEASKYLYEPNAAILKSGAFNVVSEKFNLKKLHPHTHLYTNDLLIDFPGRKFLIEKIIPYSKSGMRSLAIKKANITTRNFPESVESLRKKWKIEDGGEVYLFFINNF